MKKNSKRIIFIAALVITIVLILAAALKMTQNNLEANITGFVSDDNFIVPDSFYSSGSFILYKMDAKAGKDIVENPKNYRGYLIDIRISNPTEQEIFDLNARPLHSDSKVWCQKAGLAEWTLDLEPNSTYNGQLYVIVKVDEMSADEVDSYVRNLDLLVTYRKIKWLSIYASKIIS